MTEFKPIPYEDWKIHNPELCVEPECESCGGKGEVFNQECCCEHCGNEHEYNGECSKCFGTGFLIGDGPKLYREQVERDRKRWEELTSG